LKPIKVKTAKRETGDLPQTALLLRWYDRHRRIMPWRALRGEQADPYRVWLSEIMLQQTMVATVGPYFQKFIKRWPTLGDLATASLDDLLRMWAGLGYYRRARMLHQCAQVLHSEYNGIFPCDEQTLLGLPGFGPYTAAAVAAIAFDKPANVVDGNVERVMARIFALTEPLPKGKAALRQAAAQLVPQKRAGDYAQALMDLGATICTPRSPQCGLCPWQDVCKAHKLGIEETLPRRVKAQAKPVRRALVFVAVNSAGDIFIRQRPHQGLLAGMMEVPSGPWQEGPMPGGDTHLSHAPVKAAWRALPGIVTHVFTHFTLEATVMTTVVPAAAAHKMEGRWVSLENVASEALPSVMKKMISHALKKL
jgi:A/G-specific adenine glycosylase